MTSGEGLLFIGAAIGEIYEVDLETGAVTVRDGDDGVTSERVGRDGLVVDGALFTLSNQVLANRERLFRLWDGVSSSYAAIAWDGTPAYVLGPFSDMFHDGTSFLLLAQTTPAEVFSVPTAGGSPSALTDRPSLLGRATALAADDGFLYFGTGFGAAEIERIPRSELADPAVDPELILDGADLGFRGRVSVDRIDGGATYLFFLATGDRSGVHVITDPGGVEPRYLGRLFRTGANDAGLAYDRASDSLLVFDSRAGGATRPRVVVLE